MRPSTHLAMTMPCRGFFVLLVALHFGCKGDIASGVDTPTDDEPGDGDTPSGGRGGGIPVKPPQGGAGGAGGAKSYAPLVPVAATMQRLTKSQYENTLADVFGPATRLGKPLEPDEDTELFRSIGAAKVSTSERGVEQYGEAALDVATGILARKAEIPSLAACALSSANDPCIDEALRTIGRRLWRRPLSTDEVARYRAIVTADGTTSDKLRTGMTFALAGLLASPHFVYVVSVGEKDPQTGARRYTSLEQASRLAYWLWDSTPDEALLEAGVAGKLADAAGIEAEVRRMLDRPRARTLPARHLGEAWNIAKLDVEDKNPAVFKPWNATLLGSYKEEFTRVLADVAFDQPVDMREMFVSKRSFANKELATFYGVAGGGAEFERITLDDKRWGLLTAGAVIAANSPSDRSSPTHRGVFVVERLLCEEIPPPPANVAPFPQQEPGQNLTTRERLDMHRTDPTCAACHAVFDPAGYTFESYDGIGAHRTTEGGKPVVTTGELDGEPLANVGALAQLLRKDERSGACIAERLYTHAVGHEPTLGEEGVVHLVADQFAAGGHKFRDLVATIATSPGFRFMADVNGGSP